MGIIPCTTGREVMLFLSQFIEELEATEWHERDAFQRRTSWAFVSACTFTSACREETSATGWDAAHVVPFCIDVRRKFAFGCVPVAIWCVFCFFCFLFVCLLFLFFFSACKFTSACLKLKKKSIFIFHHFTSLLFTYTLYATLCVERFRSSFPFFLTGANESRLSTD